MGIRKVRNKASWGLYVWEQNNGKVFGDGKGNIMNIPGRPYDIEAMKAITDAAKYYGAPEGKPKFEPGIQRSSEMQYSEEVGRMAEGLIPSESDIGAWQDAHRAYEQAQREGWDYDA